MGGTHGSCSHIFEGLLCEKGIRLVSVPTTTRIRVSEYSSDTFWLGMRTVIVK